MFRNKEHIKGKTIREKETLMSLFADDTTLFLDGTEQSLNQAIMVLDSYAEISSLKINNEKTQIVWIGSKIKCGNM